MDNVANLERENVRGGFRGRPVAMPVPQEEMIPNGGGGREYVHRSPNDHQSLEENSGCSTLGTWDVVKQLQYKVASLENELMCSYADMEKLYVEVDKRSKSLKVMKEKYANLEEEYDSVASYAAARRGNLKDGESADQPFAQKCVKLEAKIAKNKALTADKEKIKLLEEVLKKLEGDNEKLEGDKKRLEGSLQKQGTELEIQRSLITRFHGMFKKVAEVASENFKEIDGLMTGLSEGGIITLAVDSPARTPMEEIGGGSGGDNSILDDTQMNFYMQPLSPASSIRQYSGGSSVIGGSRRVHNELYRTEEEEDDLVPPAAFVDACNALTLEDWKVLDEMAMEMEREKEATAANK